MKGIDAAEEAGLLPIKINMVPIRHLNEDEISDFAQMTLTTFRHVRFIEFMPIGSRDLWSDERYISTDEIKKIVERIAPLIPVRLRKTGPARYFRFEGASCALPSKSSPRDIISINAMIYLPLKTCRGSVAEQVVAYR